MILVEQRQIKIQNNMFLELDNLCFLSKNLYNSTLYAVRQHFFQTKEHLNYNSVNKQFTDDDQVDYRALPAKIGKMTQMLVDSNFKSFFIKNKNGDLKARPPKYLAKDGRQTVTYTKQALSVVKDGCITLSMTNISIRSAKDIQFVRIVPKNKKLIVIELGYDIDEPLEKTSNNIASIDLGINNLITLVSNVSNPLIINGKPLKSINQYYNKQVATLKSDLAKQGLRKSNKLQRVHTKRFNKVKDYMHKASRMLVNHLVSNDITTLVIGYNKGWKQDINLGKVTNQKFVNIPYLMLINMLKYKCKLEGIGVYIQEESYTSKCSFLDNEDVKKHTNYLGNRIKRGLFRTNTNKLINADINGALNICKKWLIKHEAWISRFYTDLVEASSLPITKVINV